MYLAGFLGGGRGEANKIYIFSLCYIYLMVITWAASLTLAIECLTLSIPISGGFSLSTLPIMYIFVRMSSLYIYKYFFVIISHLRLASNCLSLQLSHFLSFWLNVSLYLYLSVAVSVSVSHCFSLFLSFSHTYTHSISPFLDIPFTHISLFFLLLIDTLNWNDPRNSRVPWGGRG